jgi:hypothetical protein
LWGCWLAGSAAAAQTGVPIADFESANPLAGWTLAKTAEFPGADGALAIGPGHTGQGAMLQYRFACNPGARCGGAIAALWTPPKPIGVKRKGALSLWLQAAPEVKITAIVKAKEQGTRRYPFEVTTLEHPGAEWRQVLIPLAAQSTGYGDEDHTGAPQGRIVSIAILVESRYPQAMRGTVAFDDVRLFNTADESFTLQPDLSLTTPAAGSAQLAPRLGVNIHRLGDQAALDLAREAGFTFIRADLLWRQVERNGRYRFVAYDRLLNALESRGMGALWILDYGHPDHGGDTPRRPDDVAAFARFAEAAAAHFKGRNVRYEVWNEADTDRFWPPHPNAVEFALLLREAAAAIHRADPAARVASGGLARMDLPFLEATIAAGWTGDVNAVGVHPYRKAGPESLAAELPLLRQALARASLDKLEIWDTEWGYASYDYFSQNLHGDGHGAPGRQRQAVLACREALTVWSLGLPVAVWYDLHDDGDEPKNPEHNYGLLDAKNAEKPAMQALRALTGIARDHTYAGMVRDVPDGVHAMRLDGTADRVFVVWSDQPDSRITLRLPSGASAVNFLGEPLKTKTAHGVVECSLPEAEGPVYVRFPGR